MNQTEEEGGLGQGLHELLGISLSSLPGSLALLAFGCVLGGQAAYRVAGAYFASAHQPDFVALPSVRLGIGLVASLGCLAVGPLFTIKRALLTALIFGVRRTGIGRRTVLALFGRVLGMAKGAGQAPAEGLGGVLVQAAEQLPLVQAEARLRAAVSGLQRRADTGGASEFLYRRLHALLLVRIEALTLARFRAAGADGVDLVLVRDELAGQADATLADMFAATRRNLTIVFLLGMIVGSMVFAAFACWACGVLVVLLPGLRHGA